MYKVTMNYHTSNDNYVFLYEKEIAFGFLNQVIKNFERKPYHAIGCVIRGEEYAKYNLSIYKSKKANEPCVALTITIEKVK